MTYALTGHLLTRHVGGQSARIHLPDEGVHCDLYMHPRTPDRPWPRPGAEAYIIPGRCQHPKLGTIPVMLKVFRFDVPERAVRTTFLTNTLRLGSDAGRRAMGLSDQLHWMFYGFPFAWLGYTKINGVTLFAHLTRHIGGEKIGSTADFLTYKQGERSNPISWDNVPPDQRADLALQLVDMVRTLEAVGLVHGDLSHGNVLIGPGSTGDLVATLCDYDGYYHPKVPKLPRIAKGQSIRPLGTPEFQHPDIADRMARDASNNDDGLYVGTDRFALGVLVCEMMVWSSALNTKLTGETLLTQADIAARSLRRVDQLAPQARQLFPAGFDLLEKSMRTTGMWSAGGVDTWARKNLPSPDEWADAVMKGGLAAWSNNPKALVYKKVGNQPATRKSEFEIVSPQGHFGLLKAAISPDDPSSKPDPTLAQTHFQWDSKDKRLDLHFLAAEDVRRKRGGVGAWQVLPNNRPLHIRCRPGDHYTVGVWHFEFH